VRNLGGPLVALLLAGGLTLAACAGEKPQANNEASDATHEAAADPGSRTADAAGRIADAQARGARKMSWSGVLSEAEFSALHDLKADVPMDLRGETVELAGGHAYLSLPEGDGPHAGIVVIQEWWGLNDHIKLWTDRLAMEGYAALAVDLYDGIVATTPEEAMAAMSAVTDERGLEIVRAAFARLHDDPRIRATRRGSLGWCFGGGWSLRLALAEPDLDACVIYYGRLVDHPEELKKIGATVCGIFGDRDQSIPPEAVSVFQQGLAAGGVAYEIHRLDAEHAFANPSSARYDAEAAGNAWRVVRSFLRTHLLGEVPAANE
jgi:carboxymethylenebutenolidase